MSVISNVHNFASYESKGAQKSKALADQRLLVVRFKTGKDGSKRESVCASVPQIGTLTPEQLELLTPHIREWLCSVQDEIGRELVLADADHVTTEQISPEAISAYLSQVAAGSRMTGESIVAWFTSELQDVLTVAFADKLGVGDTPTDEQVKTLERMCNVYRDKFASMAGGRTSFDPSTIGKLQRALELTDTTDGIGKRLSDKLDAMTKVSVEEMLGL